MGGCTPAPIFDPDQKQDYLKDFMCFFRPGDIVKWKPITREEYDRDALAVQQGSYRLKVKSVTFSLDHFQADPQSANKELLEALHA